MMLKYMFEPARLLDHGIQVFSAYDTKNYKVVI